MSRGKFTSENQPEKNGRPKGQARTTCIRKAIFNIFDDPQNESLESFLQNLKTSEPVEFMKVMTRLAPQKIESDNNHNHNITLSESDVRIVQRLIGGKNDAT